MSAKSGENVNNTFNYIIEKFFKFEFMLDTMSESAISNQHFKRKAKQKEKKVKKTDDCSC